MTEIVVRDRESARLLEMHSRDPRIVHTNLDVVSCGCARIVARPESSGNACSTCGGITVQTGTCRTCTECGTAGGCG